MWKAIKNLFYFFVFLFLVCIVGPVLIFVFAKQNYDYKSQVVKMLQKQTGREVKINGNFQWTFFPTIGIQVNDIHVGNPAGFGNTDFLSANNADVSVNLVPLLRGQVQINALMLSGVQLNLIKNNNGEVNWKFNAQSATPTEKATSTTTSSGSSFVKYTAFTLSKVDLKDANINYEDQKNNKKYIINNLNVTSQNIAYDQSFPIETSFVFRDIDVKLKANMTINKNTLRLDNIIASTNQYQWRGWMEFPELNGLINVSGNNGALNGIDLYYYSDLAEALVNKTAPAREDTHETPFKTLSATLDIQEGIVNNNDLSINATGMSISGKGSVNLIAQQLNYQMMLQRLTNGAEIKSRGPAIPLLITGDLTKPTIRPDLKLFIIQNYGQQIQEKIQNAIGSLLS